MSYPQHIKFFCLSLMLASVSLTAVATDAPRLPDWQVLEFEEQAFWATARSRVEIVPAPAGEPHWVLKASSSVVGNSERIVLNFDPDSGQVHKRTRLSRGKDQRFKLFDYQPDFILRERRNPGADPDTPPQEWPLASRKRINYPVSAEDNVITNPYVLLLLAHRLQAQGPGTSSEVVVHTDLNFYQVRLSCGNGIPIPVAYQTAGAESVSGKRDTLAVALNIRPLGSLAEKPDFSLLGLHGEIILFFDRSSGLPLQVRGTAPRIGPTEIDLKAVTMRKPQA